MIKVKHIVLGGGIVGQMVGMLLPTYILERNPAPTRKPNQAFGTNYLWEPIPLFETKEMKIITHVDNREATEESIRRYKAKIGKPQEDESEWGLQFQLESIGHFIVKYPEVSIEYGMEVIGIDLKSKIINVASNGGLVEYNYSYLISTIPLNELVALAGLDKNFPIKTIFKFRPVYVKISPKPPESPYGDDVIYVNYMSDILIDPYRYCDRFGERHYESLIPIGFPHKKLYPGKIWNNPLINSVLKALERENIYCLGRYGRWNPNELLHETYKDIVDRVSVWKS